MVMGDEDDGVNIPFGMLCFPRHPERNIERNTDITAREAM
jgi:hypothetical protein